MKRNKLIRLFVILLAAIAVWSGCFAEGQEFVAKRKKKNTPKPAAVVTVTPGPGKTEAEAGPEETKVPAPLAAAQELADYIFENGKLPEGKFLTKKEAQALGWQSGGYRTRYVSDVAPGKSIGGDWFGNYDRKLPTAKGRFFLEADCYYRGGPRNEYRIIWSNDGHVWYTEDHYETFTELFPSE